MKLSWRCGAALAAAVAAVWLAACSPALDWRDVRPEGSALQVQFPCRPAIQQRRVALAGAPLALNMVVCSAGGQTFALAYADAGDPARVGAALAELVTNVAANVGATAPQVSPLTLPGATPNERSGRGRLSGKLPDGAAVQMAFAVFAHGTQVYQATVLGEQPSDAAVASFFESMRFKP